MTTTFEDIAKVHDLIKITNGDETFWARVTSVTKPNIEYFKVVPPILNRAERRKIRKEN